MCATQTLKCSFSMSSVTRASARWVALRSATAGGANWLGRSADQSPEPLHEAPGALHAAFCPFHIAFGRRVGKHEPARDVGAIFFDDVVGIDRVPFRLRHFLDIANPNLHLSFDQSRETFAFGAHAGNFYLRWREPLRFFFLTIG